MRLDVVYLKNSGEWRIGHIEGSQFSPSHSISRIVKDFDILKDKAYLYIPLKRYIELYVKEKSMLNDLGVRNLIKQTKEYLDAHAVWVDDSKSVTGGLWT